MFCIWKDGTKMVLNCALYMGGGIEMVLGCALYMKGWCWAVYMDGWHRDGAGLCSVCISGDCTEMVLNCDLYIRGNGAGLCPGYQG